MAVNGRIGDDLLLSQAEREEDLIHQAANATDARSSQIFSAAAILAAQPALLFAISSTAKSVLWVQGLVCIPLFFAVWSAHLALRTREYENIQTTDDWRDEEISQAKGNEQDARDLLVWALLQAARRRIAKAELQNTAKLHNLEHARIALAVGIFLNLAVLLLAATIRLF